MSLGEFARIRAIAARVGKPGPRVRIGIGDDAAVLAAPATNLLFCSDLMAEGVHFDLAYMTAADLGHKALAGCLSDVAAMNGRALSAVISLALPAGVGDEFLEGFYEGALALARALDVDIVGGDLSSSKGGIFVDVACVGEAERPITRGGARAGDLLAVSGTPGASAAGLSALLSSKTQALEVPLELKRAHLRPRPRFDLLPALATRSCTSLIDLSDGLSSEIHHLAESSGVGFAIEVAKIPIAPAARAFAERTGADLLAWALDGGEDYELLATFDPTKGLPNEGWTLIGRALPAGEPCVLLLPNGQSAPLVARGYRHFS